MNLRAIFLLLFAVLLTSGLYAQDKIYTHNGDEINASIKEVGLKNIVYKKADNSDGPSYTISKNEVEKIVYKNGTEDNFENEGVAPGRRHIPKQNYKPANDLRYGKNIFSLCPFAVVGDNIQAGPGVGLSYERMLDKKGIVSFYLPIFINFVTRNNYNNNNYSSTSQTNSNFYAMPGIKIYPTGSKGVAKYAIGTSVFISSGNKYSDNGYGLTKSPYSTYGIIINNSLNICANAHIYFGLEGGLGMSYTGTGLNENKFGGFLGQFSIRIGYRF